MIYHQTLGNQVIIHQMVYLRGHYYKSDVLSFLVWSPLNIWFWIRSWFRGEYNIVNNLSTRFNPSSFDHLDLLSTFKTTTFMIQTFIMEFAQKNNLLTDAIQNIINQNINNSQNVQNINVNQSQGVNIGNVNAVVKINNQN